MIFACSIYWLLRLQREPGYMASAPRAHIRLRPVTTFVGSILFFSILWMVFTPLAHSQAEVLLNKFGSPILLPDTNSNWQTEQKPGGIVFCGTEVHRPAQSKGIIFMCNSPTARYNESIYIELDQRSPDDSSIRVSLKETHLTGDAIYASGGKQMCVLIDTYVEGSSDSAASCQKLLTTNGIEVYEQAETSYTRFLFTKDKTYVMVNVGSTSAFKDKTVPTLSEDTLKNLIDTLKPVSTKDILAQYTIK